MHDKDVTAIKRISIMEVAARLGIKVSRNKAMCFMGHDKLTPSLTFTLRTNSWKCFGACGKSGDGIQLVREKLECDFRTALAWFESEFRVDLGRTYGNVPFHVRKRSKTKPIAFNPPIVVGGGDEGRFAADPEVYTWLLEKCGLVTHPKGLDYLKKHGINHQTADQFRLRELINPPRALASLIHKYGSERVFRAGLAWGNEGKANHLIWNSYALLFPFHLLGKVVYVQARLFDQRQKFLGLNRIAKPLSNFESLQSLPTHTTIHICEGIPDAIALEAMGLHAVAILGATSFRPEWVDDLSRFNIHVVGDGDSGGQKFNATIRDVFRKRGIPVKIVGVPRGKDAADVIAALGLMK